MVPFFGSLMIADITDRPHAVVFTVLSVLIFCTCIILLADKSLLAY